VVSGNDVAGRPVSLKMPMPRRLITLSVTTLLLPETKMPDSAR